MKIRLQVLFFTLIFFNISVRGQETDSISHHGFSLNAFAGIQGFTNTQNSNGIPGPIAGISASWYIKTVQLEFGVGYYTRFDRYYGIEAYFPGSSPPYRQIDHTQHILNMQALVNVKIVQWKRHVLSMFMGFYFRKNLNWNVDSLLNDGTHRVYNPVPTEANRSVGIGLTGGFRYTLICNKYLNFFTSVHGGGNTFVEYRNRTGVTDDLKPLEGGFQFSLQLGVQWVLSKKTPRFFTSKRD